MFIFHLGLLVSSRFQVGSYKKEIDFFFNDLLKHMLIFIS
jgi:hypothetical protein